MNMLKENNILRTDECNSA